MSSIRVSGNTSGHYDLTVPDVAGANTIALDKIVVTDSNGNLGIGSTSPLSTASTTVTVGDHTNTSGLTSDMFLCGDQTGVEGDISRLFFKNSNQSGGSAAHIKALRTGSNYGTSLAFHVQTSRSPGDGTEQMRIHDNGCITSPAQPAFSATCSSHNVNGVIVFNQASSNVGNHYNTSNGYFTAPVAGSYFFSTYGMSLSGVSTNLRARFIVNGAAWSTGEHTGGVGYVGSGTYAQNSFNTILTLSANDTVAVEWQSGYANMHEFHNKFSGFLIG